MTIETNNFIARSNTDIEKLAASIIDADQAIASGRSTFLKSLVATTQAELGSPPRQRNVNAARLDEEAQQAHLTAFQKVYSRFLDAVTRVAKNTVPDPDAAEMRTRTAFARSAGSTVRGFIRAGNDIRALAAHKVTKRSLAAPVSRRKYTVDALRNRASSLGETLAGIARNLHAANSEVARETIQPILAELAALAGLTDQATRNVQEGIADSTPIQTRTAVFVPIDLAAVRAARKAA